MEAAILEEKRFSRHLWMRFVVRWETFVVVALFGQVDKNWEISWILSRKSV